MGKIELLAPSGSRESVYAAVANGADAVYFGGNKFNARIGASNLETGEIEEIIDFCHLRGVKAYVTLNTLYKNDECGEVLEFASDMYEIGADAFILQDIGLFGLIKENFPGIKLHASTQMTSNNSDTVKSLADIGFDRVVLSRELSLDEISEITEKTNIEIETFVHGALCACYSGRCLMSSLIGGRSGNRGRCAQPCRLKYSLFKNDKILKDGYLLSPKDLMALNILPDIIRAGVHSVKIEGRMKSPEYTASVTRIYRKYIDRFYESNGQNTEIEKNHEKELVQIFNRGGEFSSGYYLGYGGKDMLSCFPKSAGLYVGVVKKYNNKFNKCDIELTEELVPGDGIEVWTRTEPHTGTNISKASPKGTVITITLTGDINPSDKVYRTFDKRLSDKLKTSYIKDTRKLNISGEFKVKIGEPLYLKLEKDGVFSEMYGNAVSEAVNRPMTKEDFKQKLGKLGNTPFVVSYTSCDTDEQAYAQLSEMNCLRREVVKDFSEKLSGSFKRNKPDVWILPYKKNKVDCERELTVSVSTTEQFEAVSKCEGISRIYIEFPAYKTTDIERARENGIKVFVALPKILRQIDRKYFENEMAYLERSDIDGYLLRHFEKLNTTKEIVFDYTLNVYNNYSLEFLEKFGSAVTLSPELNMTEINAVSSDKTEVFVYGKLPLMTTPLCPIGLHDGNKQDKRFCRLKNNYDTYILKDKLGVRFAVMPKCDFCYSEILNANPIFMLHKLDQLSYNRYLRLSFTDESPEFSADITMAFHNGLHSGLYDGKALAVTELMKKNGFTYGHFFRGVL